MSISKLAERDKKRRKGLTTNFLYIEHDLLNSENCKKMSGSAFKVYAFLRKKTCGKLKNNPFYKPLTTAIEYPQELLVNDTGLSRNTVRKAIADLIELGFIKITRHGCCKNGFTVTTIYVLSTDFDKDGLF